MTTPPPDQPVCKEKSVARLNCAYCGRPLPEEASVRRFIKCPTCWRLMFLYGGPLVKKRAAINVALLLLLSWGLVFMGAILASIWINHIAVGVGGMLGGLIPASGCMLHDGYLACRTRIDKTKYRLCYGSEAIVTGCFKIGLGLMLLGVGVYGLTRLPG